MKVAVSILNSTNIKRDLELLNNTSCDYLHIDVMDNKFVSNKNNPYDILKCYENIYNKRYSGYKRLYSLFKYSLFRRVLLYAQYVGI